MSIELNISLPGGVWQRVREVRAKVAEAASELSTEVRTAAVMVTAELVENAIKYGESVPGCEDVQVHVTISSTQVAIEVANGATSRPALNELFERVEQISTSDNREGLYIKRLEEMLQSPGLSGKLGLYRIGFEGNFELTCRHDGQILTVRATRELS
ncbi:MAG: hypothetical protein U0165_09170 [Polyangiaceae bacterium]